MLGQVQILLTGTQNNFTFVELKYIFNMRLYKGVFIMDEKKVGRAVNSGLEIVRGKVRENLTAAYRQGGIEIDETALSQVFAIVDSTITQCMPNVVSAVKRSS